VSERIQSRIGRGCRATVTVGLLVSVMVGLLAVGAAPVSTTAQVDVAALLSQPTVRVPAMLEPREVARQSVALHQPNGGSTVSLYFGDLAGQRLYVVDLFPERERLVAGAELSPAMVEQFVADNRDLLADPRNTVGTYYDEETGNTAVNVSSALPDREMALGLAQEHNQQFVFDLGAMAPIPVGGTGQHPDTLPPLSQRLPALRIEGTE
jgi:hypothetical protein